MYSKRSSLIIGFHGCEKDTRDRLVNENSLFKKSENKYDWLGHGIYFWDNDYDRALSFAKFKKEHPEKGKKPIKNPSVLGAIINLGFCLDLVNSTSLGLLKVGYNILVENMKKYDLELPKNRSLKETNEFVFRHLDCAVIETLHSNRESNKLIPFDSVRGVFWEGDYLWTNAGFRDKNHIQICIRNPNCIKGFFIPREADPIFSTP